MTNPNATPPDNGRHYLILDAKTGEALRLVRAKHPDGALARYAQDQFAVRLPTRDELVQAIDDKVPIDDGPTRATDAAQASLRG